MHPTQSILDALVVAVKEQVEGRRFALLFSGGLDSTVLAAIATGFADPTLYTVGVEGSHDLSVAESTAASLDIPWVGLVVREDEILRSVVAVSRMLSTMNPVKISFEIPLLYVSERARERTLMCGQGADELFGGYARYLGMSPDRLSESMREDLHDLLTEGVKNERRIAEHYGKELFHPYLHPQVINAACSVPAAEHVNRGVRKAVLRGVGLSLGLGEVATREKKAAQYGSGVMKVMKAAARKKGVALASFVEDLVKRG